MSQQLGHGALARQAGRGHGSGRGGRGQAPLSGPKAYKSRIAEIQDDTFNVGLTKFVAQFQKSKESTAYYVQRTIGGEEGYYAAREIRTGNLFVVPLPAALGADATDDDRTIREETVHGVGKMRQKVKGARKTAFSIVYDQCSQEVKDKLQTEQGWEDIE